MPATGKYTLGKLLEKEEGSFLLDNHYFHDLFIHKVELSDENRDLYFTLVGRLKRQYIDILAQFYPKKSFVTRKYGKIFIEIQRLITRLFTSK